MSPTCSAISHSESHASLALCLSSYFMFFVCCVLSVSGVLAPCFCQPSHLCDYMLLPNVLHLFSIVFPPVYTLPFFPVYSVRPLGTLLSHSPTCFSRVCKTFYFVTLPFARTLDRLFSDRRLLLVFLTPTQPYAFVPLPTVPTNTSNLLHFLVS